MHAPVCPECMSSEERKAHVVDLVMHRTLEDVDRDDDGLDNTLVTLGCGHIFTIETLDGLLELESYYERDVSGWRRLLLPLSMLEKPKTCPTCRREISARRYSRPIKRAILDLQETKTTGDLSTVLGKLRHAVQDFDLQDIKDQLRKEVDEALSAKSAEESSRKSQKRLQNRLDKDTTEADLKAGHTGVVSADVLFDVGRRGIFGKLAKAWSTASSLVKYVYLQAESIAKRPLSPGMEAWEAALSHSYRAVAPLYEGRNDPNARTKAMREARIAVGTPPPRADYRFRIESILQAINLRVLLVELAEVVREKLERAKSPQLWSWELYVAFVQSSMSQDATKAIHFAKIGHCHRFLMEALLVKLKTDVERTRADAQKLVIAYPRERKKVATDIDARLGAMRDETTATLNALLEGPAAAQIGFFVENIQPELRRIQEDAAALVHHLKSGTFYQAVSSTEKMMITKAMQDAEFSLTGHWYRCSNGHPFAIGDCGGAMQVSVCPECDVAIGGENHRLLKSNSVDNELEHLAQRNGTQRSPWPWVQHV
ncbi:hypothetical protein ACQY0O_000533 [Thecaphora frezii]